MTDPTLSAELQQEAFDLERDDLPEVQEPVTDHPNFAKSEVVHVRLSQADLKMLQTAAENAGRSVSDVVRAAVHRHIKEREISGEVQDLVLALHDRGLRLVADGTATEDAH
jgi:Arc/MetJ-type ribon-helix-helix transcriptional regulator